MGDPSPPSPFFERHLERLACAARTGPVLDLACGRGRHALAAAAAGIRVVGLDRSAEFLHQMRARARGRGPVPDGVRCDLESGTGIPVRAGSCGAILVFRFLFRPLAPAIAECLLPGGLLLYETFTRRQLEFPGGPRNPDFLLREGELPELFPDLEVLEYEEGMEDGARPAAVARLAARRATLESLP